MTLHEQLKSFAITFVLGFAVVLVTDIDHITLSSFKDGAIVGILFGALRGGMKGVLELFITTFSSKKKKGKK